MKKLLFFGLFILMLAPVLVSAQPQPQQPNFFKQGMDHYNAGEYDAAIASFQKVVNMKPKPGVNPQQAAQNPKKADALFYIGMSMIKKQNPGGAITNFSKALDVRPGYLQARQERGKAYIETKNFDAAVADLTIVLEAQPNNEQANFHMGSANNWRANYPEAIRYYSKVIELNPGNAYAHYWIGLAYYKTKDLKKTIDHFETFLELAPDAPEAPQVIEVLRQVQG